MIRIRIQLTESQVSALKTLAKAEGRSLSELVRECIADYLSRRHAPDIRDLAERAGRLKGRFRSGHLDLAKAHDRFLDDAFDT